MNPLKASAFVFSFLKAIELSNRHCMAFFFILSPVFSVLTLCYTKYMNININFIHLDPSDALKKFIETKFSFLSRLVGKIDPTGAAALFVDVTQSTGRHHKGEIFKATVSYQLPKKTFRVVETDANIRTALDRAKATLKQMVEEYKDKVLEKQKTRIKN